jgi:flavoprotein
MAKLETPRWAWVLTGSGHFFTESFALIHELPACDVFISKAAAEVLRMYKLKPDFPETTRVLQDKTASAIPVGEFYHGVYHTVVIAPASSNTVAKCVWGISDTLATNVFAQAGKCRIPSIVFACDTAPELETMAPHGLVKVYPRRIDLENTERLKSFERTEVVESLADLRAAIGRRRAELSHHG